MTKLSATEQLILLEKEKKILQAKIDKARELTWNEEEKEAQLKRKKFREELKNLNLKNDFELNIKISGIAELSQKQTKGPGTVKLSLNLTTSASGLTEAQKRLLCRSLAVGFHNEDYQVNQGKGSIELCPEALNYFFSKEDTKKVKTLIKEAKDALDY